MGRAPLQRGDGIAEDLTVLLARLAAEGTPCVLATVVRTEPPTSAHPGDKAVITPDGRLRGWIGGTCSEPVVRREALRALAEGTPQLIHIQGGDEVKESRRQGELMIATTCPSGGSLDIFIEPQLPKPLLLVFGDSPSAETMVRLGELTGFRARQVRQARAEVVGVALDQRRRGRPGRLGTDTARHANGCPLPRLEVSLGGQLVVGRGHDAARDAELAGQPATRR